LGLDRNFRGGLIMDLLIDSPIAHIHGLAFPVIYAVMAMAVIAAAAGIVRLCDGTGFRALPPVPATFDPYELAYLQGGKKAVIRTALYSLHRRGLLTVIPGDRSSLARVVAKADSADAAGLTNVEQRVLRSLAWPTVLPSLPDARVLGSDIERLFEPVRNRLSSEGLLRTAADKRAAMLVLCPASAVLVVITLYKIMIAIAQERPFLFLVVLSILSLLLLWGIVGSLAMARMSARGRAYVERLQLAYRNALQPEADGTGPSSKSDAPSVAAVGLFGLGILSATPGAAFSVLLAASAASMGAGASVGGTPGLEIQNIGGGGAGCGAGGGGCGGGGACGG
jgi:uncharacterized protein (TIGR04222 family)